MMHGDLRPAPTLLPSFMREVAEDVPDPTDVPVIYGTVRLIERDDESFLAWAKEPYACIIFNLHVVHTPQGVDQAAALRSAVSSRWRSSEAAGFT